MNTDFLELFRWIITIVPFILAVLAFLGISTYRDIVKIFKRKRKLVSVSESSENENREDVNTQSIDDKSKKKISAKYFILFFLFCIAMCYYAVYMLKHEKQIDLNSIESILFIVVYFFYMAMIVLVISFSSLYSVFYGMYIHYRLSPIAKWIRRFILCILITFTCLTCLCVASARLFPSIGYFRYQYSTNNGTLFYEYGTEKQWGLKVEMFDEENFNPEKNIWGASVTNINGICGSKVKTIVIPYSISDIDNKVFVNCNNLQSIVVENGNVVYRTENNCLIHVAQKTVILCCKNSTIPFDYDVTTIGSYAFSGCSGMKSVSIPVNIKTIESHAFYNCNELQSILYNGSEQQWNEISKDTDWLVNTNISSIICNDSIIEL